MPLLSNIFSSFSTPNKSILICTTSKEVKETEVENVKAEETIHPPRVPLPLVHPLHCSCLLLYLLRVGMMWLCAGEEETPPIDLLPMPMTLLLSSIEKQINDNGVNAVVGNTSKP